MATQPDTMMAAPSTAPGGSSSIHRIGTESRPLLVPIAPTDPTYARAKRTTDIVLSAAALIVLAPTFLVIALGILLTSGRPIIYRQTRLGLGGHPFILYKFRTMNKNADNELREVRKIQIGAEPTNPIVKPEKESSLVTPLGHLLRTMSLDELPQFWNVIVGEMSLVGPRPPLPDETKAYTSRDARRLSVIPGLTGLWQVSGRSNLPFAEWIDLDLSYVRQRSLSFDILILLRTVPAVLCRRGAR